MLKMPVQVHKNNNEFFYVVYITGGVELQLAKLPNGRDFDEWHVLAIPNTRAHKGSLRAIATFKHEVILPLEEYKSLSEVRVSLSVSVSQYHLTVSQ